MVFHQNQEDLQRSVNYTHFIKIELFKPPEKLGKLIQILNSFKTAVG